MIKSLEFPLKYTMQANMIDDFKKHINAQFGSDEWDKVEGIIKQIQILRENIDYIKINEQINNDYKTCEAFEQQLIHYIRHIYMLDNIFFKSNFHYTKHQLSCNFSWIDSLTQKYLMINNIRYELMCCLYNLALIYHQEAIGLLTTNIQDDKVKATSKLRRAYWCLHEIKQLIPTLLLEPQYLPADLDVVYITILLNYMIGLSYNILLSILNEKYINELKLASTYKISSQSFQIAYDLLESNANSSYPDIISKKFKMILLYNATISRFHAYFNIAQMHIKLADTEPGKCHMGFGLSYLRLAKHDIESLISKKNLFDHLAPEQKEDIKNQGKKLVNMLSIYKEKNEKSYKQSEFITSKLPEIPNGAKTIQPLEPKDIKAKLEIEKIFECIFSPELLSLRNEFTKLANLKLLELENQARNVNDYKAKIYAQDCVNCLIESLNISHNINTNIPNSLIEKVDNFKKNGGIEAYNHLINFIQKSSNFVETTINNLKLKLAQEKIEDEHYRHLYPIEWDRPISEQVNLEFITKLKDLEQKYRIAQNMDNQTLKKIKKVENLMKKLSFSSTIQVLEEMIPKNTDIDFIKKHYNNIKMLEELNNQVDGAIDIHTIKKEYEDMLRNLLKTECISGLIAINNQKIDKTEGFEKMMGPITSMCNSLSNKLNQTCLLIDKIGAEAKELNSHKNTISKEVAKIREDITFDINLINEIFTELSQGNTFYKHLISSIEKLQQIINSFCITRNIDKENRIKELEATKRSFIIEEENNQTEGDQVIKQGSQTQKTFRKQATYADIMPKSIIRPQEKELNISIEVLKSTNVLHLFNKDNSTIVTKSGYMEISDRLNDQNAPNNKEEDKLFTLVTSIIIPSPF